MLVRRRGRRLGKGGRGRKRGRANMPRRAMPSGTMAWKVEAWFPSLLDSGALCGLAHKHVLMP